MKDSNIKVELYLKTEFPNVNEEIINKELEKELQLCTERILEKLTKLVDKYSKVRVYQESA